MRREGSPWQGLGVVTLKELSDHFTSARMRVLEWLVVLVALAAVYGAIQQIRDVTAQDPFLFLRLFTTAREPLPSFVSFLSFLVPLMAIGLGFDAVNGEHNRRTLSRILSQPIYRDALLFGKFLAALGTLSVSLIALWLLVIGLGLITLGVPPGGEEMARAFIFLLVTIAYAGVWLALAMLFSVVFRSAATAALVTLGIWLFLTVIWPALAPAIAQAVVPPDNEEALLVTSQMLTRLSPSTLFGECVLALLNPTTRTLGPVYLSQLQGAVMGAPLPLWDSVMVAWPQIVGHHPVVRGRLCRLPAPGSEGVSGFVSLRRSRGGIRTSRLACSSAAIELAHQFLDEGALARQDFAAGDGKREIGDAVDFRKVRAPAGAGRPLHFERVAGKAGDVEVCFTGEGMHRLAALLPQRSQRRERAGRGKSGLLIELAPGAGKQVVGFDQAFGNRPGAFVAVAPIGTAGMREQKLDPALWAAAEGKDSGTDFGSARHGSTRNAP
jgi:ABC-2 type transport system permease protein